MYFYDKAEPIETKRLLETESAHTVALNKSNPKVSIAVLPFQRDTGDVFQQFLSDGLFDELITVLPIISGVRVVSRKQSFVQSDSEEPVSRFTALNDIDLVLDGRISEESDLFVFNLQLLSVLLLLASATIIF